MTRKLFLLVLVMMTVLAACTPAATVTQPAAPGAPEQADPTAANTEAPAVGAPTEAVAPADDGEEQVVTRALTSEPGGLDPQGVAGAGQNTILPYLFDTLVYRDIDNTYKPYLAESWEISEDGKQVTFTLRPNITFHDGTPLDAEAVKYNFDRIKEQGQQSVLSSMVAQIQSIDVIDSLNVRFTFPAPSSTLLSSLSTAYAGIVSPTAAKESGEVFGQKPVGSGAYMMESWEPGVAVTLVKNPNYAWAPGTEAIENQAAPTIDRLVFKIIPDVTQQVTAFQAGEIDMLFVNQPSHVAKLQADPNTELIETQLNSLIYLGFNLQKPPFDDVKVRQALSHVVNKEELLQTALGGIGVVAFSPLAPTLPGFDPSVKENELGFDLEKTKSLLTEAGFTQAADGAWSKDGQAFSLTLVTSTRPPNPAIATVLQSQFKAAGIPVEVQALDSTAAQEALTGGQYDLMLWRYDWNDADVLRTYLSSSRIGRTNRNFYSNSELDALLEQAAQELDDAARNALYLDAQQIILADAPWQPLYSPVDYMAIRKEVTGIDMGAMGRVMMNDAKVER